ncbi:hypothetical protein L1987_68133 [Smallanthus sonchifolius]|uniref:Uncharacterized protein n=1 Tax=Smallanthus sonchifolius TaxID=185202 RepID=A0ACB9B496_9ASTR|nr:hypothetical protein L1987_68133 [Smallanthus sonchifolius]
MVRYSDREVIGVVDNWTFGELFNTASVSDIGELNNALNNLTTRLQAQAAGGDSFRKLAVGNVTFGPDSLTIYGMMQCTPDLSREQCSECLYRTITELHGCCSGRVAARVFFPSCFARYSNEHFYNDPPVISVPPKLTSGKKNNTARTIYVVVPVVCASVGLIGIGIWFFLTKTQRKDGVSKKETTSFSSLLAKQKQTSTNDTVGIETASVHSLQYDLKTIEVATNYFSQKNKIGRGGFGLVYKGVLANGQEVAVKRTFEVDQTLGNTKKVAGTLGYMAPEYAMHGHFSVKSDVFSFGVIVLEIVSGRRNSSFYQQDDVDDLLLFAWKQWTSRRPLEMLDQSLAESSYLENDVIRCINIGLLCVQEDADARTSMASILNMLNNSSVTLPEPKKPPYFLSKGLLLDISVDPDKSIPTLSSVSKSSITEMHPR